MTEEPIELEFTVECSPEHAFATWSERISQWWPRGHSVCADPELDVVIEPRLGGRIYERTSSGDEHDWGEVTTWEPPDVLGYLCTWPRTAATRPMSGSASTPAVRAPG